MGKHWQWIGFVMLLSLLAGCAAPLKANPPTSEIPLPKAETSVTTLDFPYTLSDGIVVEQLISYSGAYWEDGSGQQVKNVAGLMIYNPTEQMLDFGAFAVEQDGQQLYFFVYQLPPKSRCLVLEYRKKVCDPEKVVLCRQLRVRWEHPELSRQQLDYICVGTQMTIINRDTRALTQVKVWYKRYDKAGDYYVGGIAYAAYLDGMLPQERRTIDPEYYDAANSRIVRMETEI